MAAPSVNTSSGSSKKPPAQIAPKKRADRYFDLLPTSVDGKDTSTDPNKKSQGRKWVNKRQSKKAFTQTGKKNKTKNSFRNYKVQYDLLSSDSEPDDIQAKPNKMQKVTQQPQMRRNLRDPTRVPPIPLDPKKVAKYTRGEADTSDQMRTRFHARGFDKHEQHVEETFKIAAKAETLLTEASGHIGTSGPSDAETIDISQRDIVDNVDFLSAQKRFELRLPHFGSYRLNYTRNGRQLLIGGRKGHVAAFDWQTKKLMCEMNVMETIHDVKWLHIETMYAVAQKQWTYIYDNQGIELHCLKALDSVLRMEFLPHHFLLATANAKGYLAYLDVSVGQKVSGISTGMHKLDVMCQNPQNAIVHLGHASGTVSLWSPNVKEPLVQMLCHKSPVRSVAVDSTGTYMATAGSDRYLKVWDLRTWKELRQYKMAAGPSELAFSQKGMLGAALGKVVEIYDDCCAGVATKPYLTHQCLDTVSGLSFCPYEDVLGVSYSTGFASLLIPGSAEANFDALETNPFQNKEQRKQAEVKMLLDKIPAELITLDTGSLGQVDLSSLEKKMEERNKLPYLKPQIIDTKPKNKKKGKSKGMKLEQRKQLMHEQARNNAIKQTQFTEKREGKARASKAFSRDSYDPFQRFSNKD